VTHASTARNTTHGPPAGAQRRVSANRQIAIDPETAFALLSDLDNHWRLADRFVDVLRLRGPFGARHGGEIRIKGPLGVRRTARTTITATRSPLLITGTAQFGRKTTAQVSWSLHPNPGGLQVELAVDELSTGPLDRVLLAIGGRRWLGRRLAAALNQLACQLATEAPG
jgi:hypothetical protein